MSLHGRSLPLGQVVFFSMLITCVLIRGSLANAQSIYINNNSSPNQISGFHVNADGSLTALPGSPYLTNGNGGLCWDIDSVSIQGVGGHLYATNFGTGTVSGFQINGDGSLTPLPGSPYTTSTGASASGVAASSDGKYLFVGHFSSGIDTFTINPDGSLSLVAGSPFGSGFGFDVIFDPTRNNVISDVNNNTVSVLTVGSGGVLTPLPASPFTTPTTNNHKMALRPQGDYLFVAGGGDPRASVMAVAADGSLSNAAGSPVSVGTLVIGTVVHPAGNVVYFGASNGVQAFSVGSGGALTALAGNPFGSGGSIPGGLAINAAGTFLFALGESGDVSTFNIAADGSLTTAPGSPYPLPTPASCPVGIAAQQSLTANPSNINFGVEGVHKLSAPQSTVLTNVSGATLTISSITSSSTEYPVSNNCPATLAPGASCTVTARFNPQALGSRRGSISIKDNAPDSPQIFLLSGTGVNTNVNLSTTLLSFANQLAGTTSTSKSVTLFNGNSIPLAISGITVSGEYTLTGGTCPAGGGTLNPGSCTILVAFAPQGGGAKTGTITIVDNDVSSPQTVGLTGTSKAITLSPTTLNFGTVGGGNSLSKAVTVNIHGTESANFIGPTITMGSSDYAITANSCSGTVVPPSCSITVTFTPTATGVRNGTLVLQDNSGNQALPLSGTGGTFIQANTASLSFGTHNVGTTNGPLSVTVTVLGTVTNVTFGTASIGGLDPSDFVIASDSCSGHTLGSGSTCQIGVNFVPQKGGARLASLNIPSNEGSAGVGLHGTGVALLTSITVTPASASATPGSTVPFTATGNYNDGSTKNLTSTASWSSSNAAAATVSNTSGSKGVATAVANGTANIVAALSGFNGQGTLTVKTNSTTSVSSNNNPSAFSQNFSLTATISPSTVTGSVRFFDGANALGTASVNNGIATLSLNNLSGGTHTIDAMYSGDSNFNSSAGTTQQVVNPAPTTTTLVSDNNPSTFGSNVDFTATIAPNGLAGTQSTGSVQFFDRGTPLGTVPLVNGAAVFSTGSLSGGGTVHSITAVYSGDVNYGSSTSNVVQQTVN